MLIGVGVLCSISFSIINYLCVSFSGLITSVREEKRRELLFLFMIIWFPFGEVSSSIKAALFY